MTKDASPYPEKISSDNFLTPSYFKEIAGNKLAFYETGTGDETILFIHGNSLSALYFKYQFESRLADKYKLMAFDLPGSGNSPKAGSPENGYGINAWSHILLEIAKSQGKSSYWLAHSLGANVALFAAAQDSSFVKGLFLSGAIVVDDMINELTDAVCPHPAFPAFLKGTLTEEDKRIIFESEFYNQSEEFFQFFKQVSKDSSPEVREYALKDVTDPTLFLGHKRFLEQSSVPVAIVEGQKEELLRFEHLQNLRIKSLWRKTLFQVPESAHCFHIEKPGEVNDLIEAFVDETSASLK